MGWNNKNRPLTITFEFTQRQEFGSVTVSTYCQLDLGIQPFSQMLAYFSADGLTYHAQYVKVVNKEPLAFDQAQNITLSLAQRVGRFVKIELYFDNKWLLISEVNFRSQSTTLGLEHNVSPHSLNNMHDAAVNEGVAITKGAINDKSDEVLSDTPHPPDDNGAAMSSGSKPNLRSKENNQVIA